MIIRWHLQAGNICIPGYSNEQHIIEDYDVWDFELTEEEMLQIAELLMSDAGAFITGSTFLADGGATASYYYGPLQPK